MRVIWFAILANIILISPIKAQSSNDWVILGQPYVKLKTGHDGIYRVTFTDLEDLGINVNSIDPRNLRLFHRGKEISILINTQFIDQFQPGDFLEYYGMTNDGLLDEDLYVYPNTQVHPEYSLFSDTTTYFLTWNISDQRPTSKNILEDNDVFNQNGLPKENSWIATIDTTFRSRYFAGRILSGVRITAYDSAEGWSGERLIKLAGEPGTNFLDFQLSEFQDISGTDINPELSVRLLGELPVDQLVSVFAGRDEGSLRLLGTESVSRFSTSEVTLPLLLSDISPGDDLLIRVQSAQPLELGGIFSVSKLGVAFGKTTSAGTSYQKVTLIENPTDQSYLEILNSSSSTRVWDITNPDSPIQISLDLNSNLLKGVIDNTIISRTLWIDNSFYTPKMEKVEMRDFSGSSPEYLIISYRNMKKGANNVIEEYGRYRASLEGGGFDTLTVEIEQLYDQFNYGETSPMAIYNFLEYLRRADKPDPLFLLIIGNGFQQSYESGVAKVPGGYYRNPSAYSAVEGVPVSGTPGSDLPYAAGIGGKEVRPRFGVGRIPTDSEQEVLQYLNKVKQYESDPFNSLGRKRILHFAGGANLKEHNAFSVALNNYAEIAESHLYGASVKKIDKPVIHFPPETVIVDEELNSGVNLITFFGHSQAGTGNNDINFGEIETDGYANQGKYPVFLMNGCRGGFIYGEGSREMAEQWLLADQKGGIAFVAHSSYADSGPLNSYSSNFYDISFSNPEGFGQSIGKLQLAIIDSLIQFPFTITDFSGISLFHQMIISGDPAIKIFDVDKPDLGLPEINAIEVKSYNADGLVRISDDSLLVTIEVDNYGLYPMDSFDLNLSIGNWTGYFRFPVVAYSKEFAINIPMTNIELIAGQENSINVIIGAAMNWGDRNSQNNIGIAEFFVYEDGTSNSYPVNYSIVPYNDLKILAERSDPFDLSSSIIVDMDTSFLFNSSKFTRYQVGEASAFINPLSYFDDVPEGKVVYWRSKLDDGSDDNWVYSSFIHSLSGEEGWNQSEFGQFRENSVEGLQSEMMNRRWHFVPFETDIDLELSSPSDQLGKNNYGADLTLDGIEVYKMETSENSNCRTLNFIAFDQISANPYKVIDRPTLPVDCGTLADYVFAITEAELESGSNDIPAFINALSTGDTVLVFSSGPLDFQNSLYWTNSLKTSLSEIGIDPVFWNSLDSGMVIGGIQVKGSGNNNLDYASDIDGVLVINNDVHAHSGTMYSPIVGPAVNWGSLTQGIVDPANDSTTLNLYGMDNLGTETTLLQDIKQAITDLSFISALDYPNLKLEINSVSNISRQPINFNNWKVTYEKPPEGLLVPVTDFSSMIEKMTGENSQLEFQFINITEKIFKDSLEVEFVLENETSGASDTRVFNIIAPQPGDTINFILDIDTKIWVGILSFKVEVNSQKLPEQNYSNNRFEVNQFMEVIPDNLSPLVEVTIDDRIILDGEIVSPQPQIRIALSDNNQFLPLDESLMLITLNKENETQNLIDPSKLTYELNEDGTKLTATYLPVDTLGNGIYELNITAQDQSGNDLGQKKSVKFKVVNESTITRFYPYPNPFSDRMRFVFTLTGLELPDEISIRITTITGRLIRQIDMSELGPIHIGNNISEFFWDGTDQYGNQLANGVYLYKVTVRKNGKTIDLSTQLDDRGFKNGIGKIYLLN